MKSAMIGIFVKVLSLTLLSIMGCSSQVFAQVEKKKEQLDVSFSSSSHDQRIIRCELDGKKHVYILEVPPAEIGKPERVAAISICGTNSSRELQNPILQFRWAALDEKKTTIPLLRIQYSKGKDFNRCYYNVSPREYTSTPIETEKTLVTYRLPTGNFGRVMRIAIVGRSTQSIGAYFKISDLEIDGISPGKTLPYSLGASDPILSTYSGNLDKFHGAKNISKRPTLTAKELAESKNAYKAANRLCKKVFAAIAQGQEVTDVTKDPQWRQECVAVEKELETLIQKVLQKEGVGSVIVAKLRWQLASLFAYSENGQKVDELKSLAEHVLFPLCPNCGENYAVSMLSPPPDADTELILKHGWFTCRDCASTGNSEPFKAH